MPMTVKQIEAARFGVDKERMSDGNGLYLRLFPNGAKRFQAQIARAPGVKGRGWVTLGDYPALGLKSARGLAARARAMADEGLTIDAVRGALEGPGQSAASGSSSSGPDRKRGNARRIAETPGAEILLRNAAKRWLENKRPTLSKGKHINQNWATIATYVLPHLGDRPVAGIKRREVVETLKPIWYVKKRPHAPWGG